MATVGKDQILEEMFEELRWTISANFSSFAFITNVTESKNGSIYVMVRKKIGKVLSEQKHNLFEMVKDISECIYKDYSQRSQFVLMNYFLYFCLLKIYSNYHLSNKSHC